jgi:hypothetical protein
MRFLAQHADAGVRVGFAQRLRGGFTGHPGTEDQVIECVLHDGILFRA